MATCSGQTRAILSMLIAALPVLAAACELTSVRYQGNALERPIVPVTSIEVLRTGPPTSPSKDLGTVTVTCPSESEADWFGTSDTVVGCTYDRAVWLAAAKAAGVGASGIHSINTGVNSAGAVLSLRATAFYYVSQNAAPKNAAPEAAAKPASAPDANKTVEERLRRLEKLKSGNLITPEEYAAKRAEILKDI
jgi:hypothetical protein